MNFDIKTTAELSNLQITKEEVEAIEKDMKEIIEFIETYGKGNY